MIKVLHNNGYILDYYAINRNVERTINGPYFLEFELPLDSPYSQLIEENMEIEASIPNNQTDLFRVRLIRKDLDAIYFYCTQVFFSLEDNFIEDTNIVQKNGLGAMLQISGATQYNHNFNFYSDIGTVANARMVRKNVVTAILGDEDNSFLKRWGGELDIHKYDVKMLTKLGENRGVRIEYKKNLTGLDGTIDYSTYYTRCMPKGFDGLLLDEKYVDSHNINTSHPIIRVVDFPDIKVKENDDDIGYNTKEEAQEALRQSVKQLYEQGADIPKASYEVDFIELSSTEEYKNYSILESIWIGDTVTVKHDIFNINARCVHYSYDPVANMYNSISLGDVTDGIIEQNKDIKDELDKNIEINKDEFSKVLDAAIKEATDLINQGLGGYVIKRRNELLIMDTEDINTAKNVWRWNINGLGFSATGYAGPFETALTNNGKIVLNEATVTKINAALIKAGILSSFNNKTWINLDNGTFNFYDKIKFDGNNFDIDLSGKDLATNTNVDNKIELNNNGINATISDVQRGLQTQINANTTGITQKVSNNEFNSYKEQTANLISSKVTSGDVSSIIKQDSTSVKIGFNGISNRFGIDNSGFYLANDKGSKVINADTSGNVNMNIWGSKLTVSATGDRRAEMWCDYYDKFILEVPYFNEGSGLWIKRDTGATIMVDTARAENPFHKVWIAEMVTPAIKASTLWVTGEKNCLQATQNYGERLINAYETADYYFGDIGSGKIINGECIVTIDDILQECINTDIEYHVFTQVYNGNITSIERHTTYFVVKGDDNTEFSWELKAKRIGYENNRLNVPTEIGMTDNFDYHMILDQETHNDKGKSVEIEKILNENENIENILLGGM
ncbi:MAG: phage tail spike protein [Cetobacterium sp.]